MFTRYAVGFIRASAAASIRCRVWSFNGHVQRDDVGRLQQSLEAEGRRMRLDRPRGIALPVRDAHSEDAPTLRDRAPDAAHPDDAELLAGESTSRA